MSAVSHDDLVRCALLLNTKAGLPKLREILSGFGASKLSDISEEMRLECLLLILSEKQSRAFQSFKLMR